MATTLTDLLASIDPAKLRSSDREMRSALLAVAEQGEPVWTGPLEGLLAALQEVARVDVCLARLVEGHCDALRIIDQAGGRPREGVYGVWASKSAGTGLRVNRPDDVTDSASHHRSSHAGEPGLDATEAWRLHGELRFASGIGLIDRALATATTADDHHLLFDIDAGGVQADKSSWNTSAMDASRSYTVTLDTAASASSQVGGVDFYLTRPGFVVGGLAVAAVWAGAARQVVEIVATSLSRFPTSPHQLRRLGLMEQSAWTAELAVASAGRQLADQRATDGSEEIARARTAAVLASDTVLAEAALVVGPGGLSRDVRLARVLADLGIYVRQHHLDNELTRLGSALLEPHARRP